MRWVMIAAALLPLLSACSTQPMRDLRSAFKPSRGYYALHFAMQQFDDGGYVDSARNLQAALDMGLGPSERVDAHKYLAFINCVSGREASCREEFRRALAIEPDFSLDDAERGHPVWGPVFASVKASAQKAGGASGDPLLQTGVRLYEDGDYAESAKHLQAALDRDGLAGRERARAHKYLAFIHCASNREQLCRDEFRKALGDDPSLALAPAEAGHPIWGPIFRAVKAGR